MNFEGNVDKNVSASVNFVMLVHSVLFELMQRIFKLGDIEIKTPILWPTTAEEQDVLT